MRVDFESWLKKLTEDIKKGVLAERDFSSYVNDITLSDCGDFNIWKKIGRNETKIDGDTTTVILAPCVSEKVTPSSINLKFENNYRTFYNGGNTVSILGNVVREALIEENKRVIQTLSTGLKTFEAQGSFVTYDALQPAIDYILPGENYADTLLINPIQFPKMMRETGFVPFMQLSPDFLAIRGRRFKGLLKGLSVYQTTDLPENEVLIYKKQYVEVKTTPLDFSFDNLQNPKLLYLNEDLYSWSADDFAIAKIVLEKTKTATKL